MFFFVLPLHLYRKSFHRSMFRSKKARGQQDVWLKNCYFLFRRAGFKLSGKKQQSQQKLDNLNGLAYLQLIYNLEREDLIIKDFFIFA